MIGFLSGLALASVLWGSLVGWLLWRSNQHIQAALNLPRASSHKQIKLHLLHDKQMRKMHGK